MSISLEDLNTRKETAHRRIEAIFNAIENKDELSAMKYWCQLANVTFIPGRSATWE